MSPKRKTRQPHANISITGGVSGVGNVVGDDSQSNVSIFVKQEQSPSTSKSGNLPLWGRLLAFVIALAGVLGMVSLFVRLLAGFDSLLILELILASLVAALGISGFLKPDMLVNLFGKILGKK